MLLKLLLPSHPCSMVRFKALAAQQSQLIFMPSIHEDEGSSNPGLLPPDDMADSESVVGVKPDDLSAVMGIRLMSVHFVAKSNICSGFMGKVSTSAHFLFDLGFEDNSYVDQAFKVYDHCLDYAFMDTTDIGTGCILWWAWCCCFFSLFRFPTVGKYHFW